jgi:hypothetical protein
MKFLQLCLDFGLEKLGSNPLTRNEEILAQVCIFLEDSWHDTIFLLYLVLYAALKGRSLTRPQNKVSSKDVQNLESNSQLPISEYLHTISLSPKLQKIVMYAGRS